MLPIFKNPMRLICRSHLLLTTALISLAPLPFGAGMAQAQMYLDNGDPGGAGPYQTTDGNWRSDSQIWNDGSPGGVALPVDQVGILTAASPTTEVELTVGGPGVGNENVWAGGLQVDSGLYTLRSGHLRSGDQGGGVNTSLSFLVNTGGSLTIHTDVTATANINIHIFGAVLC